MKFRIALILFLSTIYCLLPAFIHAQLSPEAALQQLSQNIDVSISPENPGPNTDVTIRIESYSTDLNGAQITWVVNGKIVSDGMGEKVLKLKTGNIGTITSINLSVQPSDGDAFQKTIDLAPASVDLLWQGDSYTPPFYKGRAVFTNQGSITFVAIPSIIDRSGNTVSPKNVIYTWSKDGSVLGSLSGTGKNSLTLLDSILGLPMNISVVASTLDNSIVTKSSISMQSGSPIILFYENNPLLGILYNREIGSGFKLSSPEVNIIGAPYFFSNKDLQANALKYTWALNGSNIGSPNQNSITLRGQHGAVGNSTLGLKIENVNNILQTLEKSMNIEFGSQNNL